MEKSPLDMDYHELDNLLDSLLDAANLPSKIEYSSNAINYSRPKKTWIKMKILYRLIEAQFFNLTYIRKRLNPLKKTGIIYDIIKKERIFLKFNVAFSVLKIMYSDVLVHLGANFDNKMATNFIICIGLYDASFDVVECRKYLKDFDTFIMSNKPVEPRDEYLALFKESIDYLRNAVDKTTFDTFMNYVKIEHVVQMMSICQLSDKKISKEQLYKITLAKGGIGNLAGMYIVAPKMREKEKKAIYELGAILQIFDDIMDIKEDLKMGIQTLPNQKLIDRQELRQLYFGSLNNLIEKLNFDPNRPNVTLDIYCMLAGLLVGRRYNRFIEKKIFSQIQKTESYNNGESK
ncbi:MAG: hypothetical protein JSW06_06630 [Thermoplasmatales archaeon]|nr:MAG: hypothetical protein JSW06_06630 [Thermoplasmatales archaeon]